MAYTDSNDTAWGKVVFKYGAPGAGGSMGTVLKTLGVVKEDSYSLETEDGKEYKFTAIGGEVIDQLKGEPTLKAKLTVKNLNKALISEIWDVEESGDNLIVKSLVSTKKFSVSITPVTSGSEKIDIFYCSISGKPTYTGEDGYCVELEITMLRSAKGLFSIGRVA